MSGPVAVSVADARATEGEDATLDFAVTLDRAASHRVTVDYATDNWSATAGADYTAASGTLTFGPGETAKTVSVTVLDDVHDEGMERMKLRLSNASGATIADALGIGTINNSDPLQRAWNARFGRTAAGHVIDAVQGRLGASRQPGATVTLAGQSLGSGATLDELEGRETQIRAKALGDWL